MNSNPLKTRSIRIFISSTFQDMSAERDQLVTKVFHKLRKLAAKRNVTLTEIDLRWGITEEEAQSSRVVEICMDEIGNSHPFFIGLLGNRYGWCPEKEDLLKSNAIPPKYSWIEEDLGNGLSITEIEMQYAALRAEKPIYASFYILNDGKPNSDRRQQELKRKIRDNGRYPVYDYHTAEELGEQVEQEFIKLLDNLFPEDELTDTTLQERAMQEVYIESKAKGYIPNREYVTHLDNFLDDENSQYMVVTGESGIGKSSLLAYWIDGVNQQQKWNSITYFASASNFRSDSSDISQKLTSEIDFLYNLGYSESSDQTTEHSKNQSESNKDKLAAVLAMIGGQKPLLIVLDGLNQFAADDREAKLLNWLPGLPANVKVIFSTTEDDGSMQTFRRRGYPTMKVYPLLADQRKELICSFFDSYSKRLSPQQLDLLINASNITHNTMVLISLLEEIRCFGNFDKLNEFIDEMTSLPDYGSFFDRLLDNKEATYNTEKYPCLTEEFLSLIALSKDGLTETELVTISGVPQLYWSQLYCANTLHFTTKNGRVDFAHNLIRKAVLRRVKQRENEVRKSMIVYFEGLEDIDHRKIAEYPYQLYKTGNWGELFKAITTLVYLKHQVDNKNVNEFALYWRTLAQADRAAYPITEYIKRITEYKGVDVESVEMDAMLRWALWQVYHSYFYHLINICLVYLDDADSAHGFAQFLLKMIDESGSTASEEKSSYYNILGMISIKQRNYVQAMREFREALRLNINSYGEEDSRSLSSLFNIGEVYNCMGEAEDDPESEYYEKAEIIFSKILELRIKKYGGIHQEVALAYSNLGSVYQAQKRYEESEACRKKSEKIFVTLNGDNDIDVAIQYHNDAQLCVNRREFDKAKEYSLKALEIYLNILGELNVHTQEECYALSLIERDRGDYDSAAEFALKAVEIEEKLNGRSEKLVKEMNRMIYYYIQSNRLADAEKIAKLCIEYIGDLKETPQELLATVYDNTGKIYLKLNDSERSIAHYLQAAQQWREQGNQEKEAASYSYIGMAYYTFSELEQAKEALHKTLEILDDCAGDRNELAAYTNYNIGAILFTQGNIDAAQKYVGRAYAIRLELFGEDDSIVKQYKESIDDLRQRAEQSETIRTSGYGLENSTLAGSDAEFVPELEEFNDLTGGNEELAKVFYNGWKAFIKRETSQAKELFNYALYCCDKYEIDRNSAARAILLRYQAYTHEIAKEYESAEELYRDACDIASDSGNAQIALRIFKERAEFYWNRANFERAELSYWEEAICALELYGFYHRRTLICFGNIFIAMTRQDECDWKAVLGCCDLIYHFSSGTEDGESMINNAKSGIDTALHHLSEDDDSYSVENYRHLIDRDRAILSVIDYLISIGKSYTANKLIHIYLDEICAKEGTTPETLRALHYHMIRVSQNYENYIHIIEIVDWLRDNPNLSNAKDDGIPGEIDMELAVAYEKLFQYDKAIPIFEQQVREYGRGRLLLAECYRAVGRVDEAITLLDNLREDRPDTGSSDQFLFVYGKSVLDAGFAPQALDYFTRCREVASFVHDWQIDICAADALLTATKEMEAWQLIRKIMDGFDDWDGSGINKLEAHIHLIAFMLKAGKVYEAEKINNDLKELLLDHPRNRVAPYVAHAEAMAKRIEDLKTQL